MSKGSRRYDQIGLLQLQEGLSEVFAAHSPDPVPYSGRIKKAELSNSAPGEAEALQVALPPVVNAIAPIAAQPVAVAAIVETPAPEAVPAAITDAPEEEEDEPLQGHELAASILGEAYDTVFFDYYAPQDPKDPQEALMSVFMVKASRSDRPWEITLLPCDPEAFKAQNTYTADMVDQRRYRSLYNFISDLEESMPPHMRIIAHEDDSFTIRGADGQTLLYALKAMCEEQEYPTLDTQIEMIRAGTKYRDEDGNRVFPDRETYKAYLRCRTDQAFREASGFPAENPDRFTEFVPAMVFVSRDHAAYCGQSTSNNPVCAISFSQMAAEMAVAQKKPIPSVNPLLDMH